MRTMLVALGLLIAGSASAKPLPGGMKIVTKLGRPYVQQGAFTVALRDDDVADYEKIAKAELDTDGKTVVVTATRCKGALADDTTRVSLTKIKARFDNAAGLVAMAKKKYGEAVTRFTAAAQKDPETPAYATNLLGAELAAKKLELASQTMMLSGRRNPIWLTWRILVDPALAAAQTNKRWNDLAATKPGGVDVAHLGDRDLATTTSFGGIAALRTLSIGSPGTSEVDFISLSTGALLARLPLVTLEDACDGTSDHPCDDAANTAIAGRTATVNTVLARLGFALQKNALVDVRNGDPITKDDVTVATSDDELTITRAGADKQLKVDGNVWSVAILPEAVVIKVNRRNLYGCEDGSSRFEGGAVPR